MDNLMEETNINSRKYCVYLITNLANGKQYVGQTCQALRRRWRGHVHDAKRKKNTILCHAINKYGENSFKIEILCEGITKTQANEEERRAIKTLRLTDDTLGYNMTLGGEGCVATEECRKRMREANRLRRRDVESSRVAAMFLDGKPATEIAQTFGISLATVYLRLNEVGIRASETHELPEKEILDLYNSGIGSITIGRQLNIGDGVVLRVLKQHGVPIRDPNSYQKDVPEGEVVDLYNQGKTIKEIAFQFGITNQKRISEILKSNGTSIRIKNDYHQLGLLERVFPPRKFIIPIDELEERYLGGESMRTLAKHFGCTVPTIRVRLQEAKVKLRNGSERRKLQKQMKKAA